MIETMSPPAGNLLTALDAGYADSFRARIDRRVGLSDLVLAFYTSPLFRAERAVLRLGGIRSSDAEARELSEGRRDSFAAWYVAERTESEILLPEKRGPTASWLMAEPDGDGTFLWFGTAIRTRPGKDVGGFYRALTGAHVVYSRLLLRAARARLAGSRFREIAPTG
ncbi:MAG: hypothetical protein ACU0DK_13290 [Pseudooceanicola sp.]